MKKVNVLFFFLILLLLNINFNHLSAKNKISDEPLGCSSKLTKNYFLNYYDLPIKKIEIDYSKDLDDDLSNSKKEKNIVITPFMKHEWKGLSRIKKHVGSTFNKYTLSDIGSFGGCFNLPASDYKNPVLVSSADGVGTKLLIAALSGKHDTVGQCLVNHCVNDILVIGAKPMFFLDYFAAGKLNQNTLNSVVEGLTKACIENSCVLIGGETAEMPGFYKEEEYDISGTIIGVVEKEYMMPAKKVNTGDLLYALPSTGLHTNGLL